MDEENKKQKVVEPVGPHEEFIIRAREYFKLTNGFILTPRICVYSCIYNNKENTRRDVVILEDKEDVTQLDSYVICDSDVLVGYDNSTEL